MLHKHRGISSIGAFCERPRANTVRPYREKFLLFYKHRVAKAEEAILLLHRRVISGKHILAVIQRRDEHQQGRLGQMEIGDQRVHRLEAIAGVDENTGIARSRGDVTVLLRHRFDGAAGGGANADQPSAGGLALVDDASALLADREKFGVHPVRQK